MKLKISHCLILLLFIIFTACQNEVVAIDCDSTNTTFNQLFNNLKKDPINIDKNFMDLEIHSYTFEVLSTKMLCKIGYQSLPNFNTTPYLIEILDNTSNKVIYSGNHLFSHLATSYISITPIQLPSSHSFTIKRIQNNWNRDITNTLGRIAYGNLKFPIIHGDLQITSSLITAGQGGASNYGLPYIDLVFEK